MTVQTLDMRLIRYLNLFSKMTKVRSKNCFFYNNNLVFAVPATLVSKSIGESGKNVKKLAEVIGKRVKVVALPESVEDAERFISDIIDPIQFKSLEVSQDEIIITASRQSKAALIGRNRVRYDELAKVIKEFFGKNLRIV